MANIKCSKCGELGNSKCPYCRSIFASNQVLAIAEYSVLSLKEEGKDLIITIQLYGDTLEEKLAHLRAIASQPIGLLCSHSFKFLEGEESSIGCGHKYQEAA